jgi:hypothetical protein
MYEPPPILITQPHIFPVIHIACDAPCHVLFLAASGFSMGHSFLSPPKAGEREIAECTVPTENPEGPIY